MLSFSLTLSAVSLQMWVTMDCHAPLFLVICNVYAALLPPPIVHPIASCSATWHSSCKA